MTDLDKLLAKNSAPAPRAGLADEILQSAQKRIPANDSGQNRSRLWMAGSIAAMALFAAVFVFQSGAVDPSAETEHWEYIADNSGFADLYAWVEEDS